jgi:hypothetical protein
VPPSLVLITVLPPTAIQVVADGHATALSVPATGTVCCTQVEPPSLEAKTISDFRVVSPTAKHCDAVGQAMAFRFREEAAYASVKDQDVVLAVVDVELLPDAAVVVGWPPLRKLPGTRSCEFVRPSAADGERPELEGRTRRRTRPTTTSAPTPIAM